jgi:hypothetical protein
LAGALVTLAGPLSFGCADSADGAPPPEPLAAVPPAALADEPWPAVGSTACGCAVGTLPVTVDDELVDEVPTTCARVAVSGGCVLEPQPAASTTTAIAVTPAARMR